MSEAVLFWDCHAPGYLPLARAVAGSGLELVLNESGLADAARDAELPFRTWESLYAVDAHAHVQSVVTRLVGAVQAGVSSPTGRAAFASPAGNFLPHTGDDFFRELVRELGNQVLVLETFEELRRRVDLRVLVLGYDNNHVERALIAAARGHGIPSLHLAHGLFGKKIAHVAGDMPALHADFLAGFGERAREIHAECGVEPGRVLLTGAPLWDPLYEPAPDPAAARAALGLDPSLPTLLWCSSYTDGGNALLPAYLERLLAANRAVAEAARVQGLQLIVRPHPSERARTAISAADAADLDRACAAWFRGRGVENVVVLHGAKREAFAAADLVLAAGQSTVLPEAMIARRPVVCVTLLHEQYVTYPSVPAVEPDASVSAIVRELLDDPARRAALVEAQDAVLPSLNEGNDGRATERVAAVIESLARPTAAARAA